MNRLHTIIALALAIASAPSALAAEPTPEDAPLWTAGKDGYHTYRIPSLLVTGAK
jgi:hypothetical protein